MTAASLRVYFVIARQAWREAFIVPEKIVAALFVLCLRVGLLFAIYRMAYQFSDRAPNSVPFTSAVWSIGAYFVLLSFMIRHIYVDISREVKQGTIEMRLSKPYYYPLLAIAHRLGRGLPDVILSFVATMGILVLFVGWPPVVFSGIWLGQVLLLVLGGLVLASLLYTLVGLSAFWLEDAEPVYWIFDKFVMLLGGAYVPVVLFPAWLKTIAIWLPFGGFTFAAQAFHSSFTLLWGQLMVSQLLWIIVLGGTVSMVFRRARARVSINGG